MAEALLLGEAPRGFYRWQFGRACAARSVACGMVAPKGFTEKPALLGKLRQEVTA